MGVSSLRRAGFTSLIVNEYRHFKHHRRDQDRRDAGGLHGGGAVGNLCQRGHASGRRPRHGFALTRKSSSRLQAPWRDFSSLKLRGGPAGRRTGENPGGAKNGGDLGAASGDDGAQRATSGYEVMGVRRWGFGSPTTPLSPPLLSLLSSRLEAAAGSTGAAPTPRHPPAPDLRPTLPPLAAGKAQQKGRAGKARP